MTWKVSVRSLSLIYSMLDWDPILCSGGELALRTSRINGVSQRLPAFQPGTFRLSTREIDSGSSLVLVQVSRARHFMTPSSCCFFVFSVTCLPASAQVYFSRSLHETNTYARQEPQGGYAMPPPQMPSPAALDEEGTNLMDLPVECRIKIYRNVLQEDEPYKIKIRKWPSGLDGAYHPTFELKAKLTLAQATTLSVTPSQSVSSRLGPRRQ